jgi:hypothetical protein
LATPGPAFVIVIVYVIVLFGCVTLAFVAIATVRLGDGADGEGEWLDVGAGGCESTGLEDGRCGTGLEDGTGVGAGVAPIS